ncbi:MAG TPA: valine--tRNA ligase [Verrucomicrobiae bacterium]|nr:valine--tRNA ligase [Verrucomicrobiae bacterium]
MSGTTNSEELAPVYDPKALERRIYARWEERGYFHEEPDPARPAYVICMPPPNVTGRAHLGHGSTYTPMDVMTRYHRMLGDNAVWLPGLDHAAIATEAVLLKEMAREGLTREALGRPAYLERAWAWARTYGGTIDAQFATLGFGPDWARKRFTMDDGLSAAVRKVFVQLYREGLIYRGKRLVNWDPKGQTTVSDAEVDHVEREATLWHVRYPGQDGGEGIVVATTRPETILADVAIAVHPQDERYRALIGTKVLVPPLRERAIPVIADEAVDRGFGTGAVKVTPAHDATDYEIGLRHGLPAPSVIDLQARITDAEIGAGPYAGLDRFEARSRIVEDLRVAGLLAAQEAYRHAVSVSERTGDVIEPLLSEQWFCRMTPLAKPALDAYREGRLRFVPERHGRTYEAWLENIRDWNVSRQVWWGHQIPAWYTPDGSIVVAETEEEARAIALRDHGGAELVRDTDTLDTWFSSGIWPFSILGWPQHSTELACWYPSQVLMTGGDIIFLWVARMVMLGIHFMGEVPFPDVFVAPTVFDAQGRKMSKSLGNAIDPMDLVERYGADAFRIGILRQMRIESQEIRFHESRCDEARKFANKIWNAVRYALALAEGLPAPLVLPENARLTIADRWILTRLHDTIVEFSRLLDGYDFGNATESIVRFFWYELCDWYLEATKEPGNAATRASVLSFALNNALRLLHPIAPFVSEELWLALPHDGATIMTATWPDPLEVPVDRDAAALFAMVQATVERLRNERAENGIADRVRAAIGVPAGKADWRGLADLVLHFAWGNPAQGDRSGDTPAEFLAGFAVRADPAAHAARLHKEAARLRGEVARAEKNLANPQFVAKAAEDVVAKEREKLQGYRTELARAESALAAMKEHR